MYMLGLQGAKYNIPVRLWLPEKFPYSGPLVFVEPTPEMMIMQNHPFVNANGAVSTDYLRQWGRGCALPGACRSPATVQSDRSQRGGDGVVAAQPWWTFVRTQ